MVVGLEQSSQSPLSLQHFPGGHSSLLVQFSIDKKMKKEHYLLILDMLRDGVGVVVVVVVVVPGVGSDKVRMIKKLL